MTEFENNAYFWQKADTLFLSSNLKISKHKGEVHHKFKNLIYPVEYGHLEDTISTSPSGISVYLGSGSKTKITGVVVAADILIKTIDIKILVGCNEQETYEVLHFLNQTDFQKTIFIQRGNTIPNWGLTDN